MNVSLGIIGGGQLAYYLCEAAQALGVSTRVLVDVCDAPAVHTADQAFIGPLDDPDTVEHFIAHCDVVTIDREDIPETTLSRLARAERQGQIRVNPGIDTLFLMTDKGLQKAWLQQHGFPRLPHRVLQDRADCHLGELAVQFGLPLVQKARKGGFDGRGVQVLSTREELGQLWDTPSIIEPWLPNCREISVVTARNPSGAVRSYPPLEMSFNHELNALDVVSTPARLPEPLARQAVSLAESIVRKLRGVGVFAVEMFLSERGELLVNEISPRVHNSGHLTLEAAPACQFEQHVRAVLNLPLAEVEALKPAAMVNLLYSDAIEKSCPDHPLSYRNPESPVTVHWYGKPTGRYGRKMGHITAVAETPEAAAGLAERALSGLNGQFAENAA